MPNDEKICEPQRNGNVKTGRDGSFYWCATNIAPYVSYTFTTSPAAGTPVAGVPAGDIFSPVFGANGGAVALPNTGYSFDNSVSLPLSKICFEIDLYDKKRGRSITDGRMPSEVFTGLTYNDKSTFGPMRWYPDTEIEPRVYVNEVIMSNLLTNTYYNAASVAAYLCVCFSGFSALEENLSSLGAQSYRAEFK